MSEQVDAGGGKIEDAPVVRSPGGWNPPADLAYGAKIEVLRDYAQRYELRTMVETGLYNGNGSGMQMQDLITSYYIIDLHEEQVQAALAKGYCALHGDSGELLPMWLDVIQQPVLFWLDAHLVSEADEPNSSPLLAELDAILAWPHAAQSVVLIDDIRMMGREGWPSVEQVRERVGSVWLREERADILRLTPRG